MAEDLDESLLLGDDDEGGHGGGDFNEDELLYEGDEDTYGGGGEGDDVLDLELEEEELDTPDTTGDNGLAHVKVRTQVSSQSAQVATTPAASVTSSSENLPSLTPAGSFSTLKSVGDSDDDEESPRQRQRFTTERKTDDLNAGGGGASTGPNGRSIASIGNRGGFRGGRGGFVTRGGPLRQMGPRGMQNQGNMRMRNAPPGAFGQRQRFPGHMHRFPPQHLMPGPDGAGMPLLPFPGVPQRQPMHGAAMIMNQQMNQFPPAGLLPPPGPNMQGGPQGMNPNRMNRPQMGQGNPNFPPGPHMQDPPDMPPRQFAPRNQRFPPAGFFPNRQWTPNMPPQGNMPMTMPGGGPMDQGYENYPHPSFNNGPQGPMSEFGAPQQYNEYQHHQQAMNQPFMSNLNPEAPPFMSRLPNGMNAMNIPPGAHINPDFKGPPPVLSKTDEYFSEELFGSPSKDRRRYDRSPDRYDERRRDDYRFERSPDRYEKSRRGASYDRDRSRSPTDRYDSRRGDSYRRSPESRYREEGRRYSPERYREDYRDDYDRSRRRGYDDDFSSDGRRTVVNRTVRARSRSKSPNGERKLQGRLGPPIKGESRQTEKVAAISKESQNIVGVDDQYLRRVEQQKEMRARILREKEARRRKQLGQDEEPEIQKQSSPQRNPFVKPAVLSTAPPGQKKTSTKVLVNPNALKGSSSSVVRVPGSVATAAAQGGQKIRKILRIVRNKKGEIIEKKKVLIMPKASTVGGSSTRVPTTSVK